jgi:predicted HTH domain antitoxin
MSVAIDLPKNIEIILDQRAREEHIDRISVLRQMLLEGAECYLVYQYSNGKITKGRLAELLDLDIYEVNELLEKYHIKSSISYERFTRGIKYERCNTRRRYRLKALPAH